MESLRPIPLGLLTLVTISLPLETVGDACQPGLVFPIWLPQGDLELGERVARGLVYFLGMLYMFIGVSIISDRFMGSIEVITSKEKEIMVKRPDTGEMQIVVVRVWNETVANLTLMALGSSAPEILLSVIEIIGKEFESGELGPGTIVGSAAFNLFIIIAICVYVIPDGEVRRIKHLRVFFVTAAWSIFAYIWLLIILKVTSPGVVEIWEGLITFLFFPATVITAYIADRRLLIYKFLSKSYRLNKRGLIVEGEANMELGRRSSETGLKVFEEENVNDEIREFEQNRRDYIQMLRDLRKKHPNCETEALEALAREEILNKGPKSRAFYRMQATRRLISGQNLMKRVHRAASESMDQLTTTPADEDKVTMDPNLTSVYFDQAHYTVMESVGEFEVIVARHGGDLTQMVLVDYQTEDGTASADTDYIPVSGTLIFDPGEIQKQISIQVLDDDVFEEDEHFYIRLSEARFAHGGNKSNGGWSGGLGSPTSSNKPYEVQVVNPFLATVMILDDDHGGVFNIVDKDTEAVESIGQLELRISRWSGARGKVLIPYTTIEGTGKPGKDYEHVEGNLLFENNETEKIVTISIIEEDSYEKDVLFYLEISDPIPLGDNGVPLSNINKKSESMSKAEIIALEGWPKLGPDTRAQIRVKESKEFKNTVDKLLQRANASLLVGTSSWKEQFLEAITVNPGGDDDDDDDEMKSPSCGDYVMHFLTVFWKVIFAFVPPTECLVQSAFCHGYFTFVTCIAIIGVLTALIGDLATHFGCSMGVKDSVTAIIFVALGTSVPGIWGGYLTFVVSIIAIGALTALIGDLASHLGCTIGLKDSVTAIAFVALGTSVPDTFASKVAAVQDEYADASVGNVTGSNAVNVFLGIGIAWTIAAVAHFCRTCTPEDLECNIFKVSPGSLGFSVTLFCVCAVVAVSIMLLRRLPALGGGELGGPTKSKYCTSILFVCLWVFYVVMSSFEAYDIIEGF